MSFKRPIQPTRTFFVQYFDNGNDQESLQTAHSIEAAGYSVQFVPTSGPPALWVEGYEVVGRTAIRNVAEQLVQKRASG